MAYLAPPSELTLERQKTAKLEQQLAHKQQRIRQLEEALEASLRREHPYHRKAA